MYLGSILTTHNDLNETVNRIKSANRAYHALLPLLKSQAVLRISKINIYKTLIRPLITYDSEPSTLNAETCYWLAVFERKILRKIIGAVHVEDTWRRRHNNELMEMYGDLDVISFIRLNRLRWIGHVSRMDINRKVHQVCYTHPEGKRLRGRPKTDGGYRCRKI